MKNKTNYQARVSKLVWVGNIYGIGMFIYFYFKQASFEAWVIYISTLAILYGIAAAADAVFDSINERINVQSSWLHVRLGSIENHIGAKSGQQDWKNDAMPTNDSSHYYDSFPERIDG